jgi:hypothetical protein
MPSDLFVMIVSSERLKCMLGHADLRIVEGMVKVSCAKV